MDISGIDHIAPLTSDLDRLTRFYEDLFAAKKVVELPIPEPEGPGRHALIAVGAGATLHAFEIPKVPPRLSGRCSNAGASIAHWVGGDDPAELDMAEATDAERAAQRAASHRPA